jgi:hypothetical protein
MSKVKKIQFSATIEAPVEVVWRVMFGAKTYPQWTKVFAEGSYFEGSWSEGSRIRFLVPSGDGMIAEIAENRPHEFMSIRHLGFVAKGVEDTESEAVRAWAPAYENYTFTSIPGGTRVTVEQDVTADFEQFMREAWPKALELLGELCAARGAD